MKTNNFKGIIFDLDGTLVNSLEDIALAMNNILRKFGLPAHEIDDYKYLIGNGIYNLVLKALPESLRTKDGFFISHCHDFMMREYSNNCLVETRLYDGIEQLLLDLKQREVKIAVFSNKIEKLTLKIISKLLPEINFDAVIGAREDVPKKPDPAGAIIISNMMGIKPENMLYVGDSDVDMQASRRAGMYSAGALWGFRDREELVSSGADFLVNHPAELLQLLY